MKWLWVAVVVLATVVSDLLQAREMKRQGEIDDFRPTAIGRAFAAIFKRRWFLLAVCCMAISFFAFLELLRVADLSFAVPATAATYVAETILARSLLKERVEWQRWAGAGLVSAGIVLLAL